RFRKAGKTSPLEENLGNPRRWEAQRGAEVSVVWRKHQHSSCSSALSDLGGSRDVQRSLVDPAASGRGGVPALERDRADLIAFLILEYFKERAGETGTHLRGGTAEEDETFGTVIENGDGAPALRLGLSVVKHGLTLLGQRRELSRPTGCLFQAGEVRARS